MPKAIKHPKPKKKESAACPTCGRVHWIDEEFGPFCCASCLQTVIRPLVLSFGLKVEIEIPQPLVFNSQHTTTRGMLPSCQTNKPSR